MKKYFWLKLKDNFFQDKKIKKLRKIAGGDTFTIIYLKMQLLSLKEDGFIKFDDLTSEFYEEIALELDEDEENVRVTLNYLLSVGLIEEVDSKSIAMIETIDNIGRESESASRVRKLRERQKESKKALQCNVTEVTCNTEIEKELEIELEKEIVSNVSQDDTYPYDRIVDYLNRRVGSSFKSTSIETRKLIKARFKQGATAEDFKTVIDKKYKQWHNNPKMVIYLRPKTLFGTKFTEYLGEAEGLVETKDSYHSNKTNRSVLDELIEKEENYSGIIGSGEVIQRNGQVLLQQSEVE